MASHALAIAAAAGSGAPLGAGGAPLPDGVLAVPAVVLLKPARVVRSWLRRLRAHACGHGHRSRDAPGDVERPAVPGISTADSTQSRSAAAARQPLKAPWRGGARRITKLHYCTASERLVRSVALLGHSATPLLGVAPGSSKVVFSHPFLCRYPRLNPVDPCIRGPSSEV